MAEILGVGMTHYPGLIGVDELGSSSLARVLKHNPRIPDAKKAPNTWPEAMRLEFADILIAATALTHNLAMVTKNVDHFRRITGLRIESWRAWT